MSRVLLLTEAGENRRILAEWLGGDHDVVEAEDASALDGEFDCCLLDRTMFGRHEEALRERKRRERPVVLPYLFVIGKRERDRLGPDLWRRLESVVRDRVDEFITAPIRKAELKARLDALLRSRSLSVELREQRDRLRTLDRLNAVIRSIDQSLVQASTRDDIEQAVCERLVGIDRYVGAWVGNDRATSREVVPRASAGAVEAVLDGSVACDAADRPAEHTVETGDRTVVRPVCDGETTWHEAAGAHGVAAAAAVPLLYEGTTYGVLTVYADDPETFADEDEVAVLRELGETIGHAINAADSRRALLTDRVTQFEFGIDAPDAPLRRLATAAGCTFEFRGIVSATDGSYLEYYSTPDADPERLLALAEEADDIERVRHLGDHDGESLFELRFDDHVVQTIGSLGGRATALRADATGYHVTAEFPRDADRHTVVDSLAGTYGAATLLAQRETERELTSQQEIWKTFRGRLTDQQWSALKAAHLGGFFEWPRGSTGEEVADSLDISAPTFHEHLRAAQRKLLETLLGD